MVSNAIPQPLLSYLVSQNIDSITDLYNDTTDLASNRRNSYNIYNDYNSLNTTSNFLCKVTIETYKNQPKSFIYDSQFGDFELYRNYIDDCNVLIYKTLEPTPIGTIKKYIIAIRGTQTMYDYMIDFNILHDYSDSHEGVENYLHLYSRLLDDVYTKITEIIIENTDNAEIYITGHSLGGTLAMDSFNRLVTYNLNAGVYCYLYNPFTVNTVYAQNILDNIDGALLGIESKLKYFALKTDIHCQITQGDYISALYLNFFPGNISVYPSISSIQNYLPSLLNVSYNAILSNNNHTLNNFTNKTDLDVDLILRGQYYVDDLYNLESPIHLSYGRIINKTTKDLSSIGGSLNNDAHLHLKAVSQTDEYLNLIVLETDDDHLKYLWEFRLQTGLYKTYFIGNSKYVTPIYKIINHEYNNNVHYIYLQLTLNNNYNIIKVNSSGEEVTNSSLWTQSTYNAVDLSNKRTTGIDLLYTNKSTLTTVTQTDAIQRREWTIQFGETGSVIPIQDESSWFENDLRRLIKHDIFTHIPLTSGVHLISNAYSFTSSSIDDRDFDVYLRTKSNDINLRVGYTNIEEVGGADAYKWTLTHNGYNYTVTNELNHSFTANVFYHSTVNGRHLYVIGIGINLLEAPTLTQQYVTWGPKGGMLFPNDIVSVGGEYPLVVQNSAPIVGSYTSLQLWSIEPATTQYVIQDIPSTFGSGGEGDFMYGEFLMSPNKQYLLYVQGDGGVFWSRRATYGATTSTYLWSTSSHNDGNALLLRSGRLEVWGGGTDLDENTPLKWHSNTNNIDYVRANNNGQLQGIDAQGNVVWYVS